MSRFLRLLDQYRLGPCPGRDVHAQGLLLPLTGLVICLVLSGVAAAESAAEPTAAPEQTDATPAQAPAGRASEATVSFTETRPKRTVSNEELRQLLERFRAAMAKGDMKQAEAMLAVLRVRLPPQSLTLLRLQAWLALERKEYPRAIGLYGSILQRQPNDLSSGFNQAVALLRAGEHGAAGRAYQRLRAVHGDHPAVRELAEALR